MQRKYIILMSAAVLAVAIVFAASQGSSYAQNDSALQPVYVQDNSPLKIGVVNIAEVFEKSNERDKREKELQAKMDEATAKIEDYKRQAQALQEEADKLEKGSPEYTEINKKRVALMAKAEIFAEQSQIEIQNRESASRQELYSMIREAVDKYAAKNGYDLVLKIDDNRISGKSIVTQDIQMSTRIVLYNSQKMDLTKTIIDVINK